MGPTLTRVRLTILDIFRFLRTATLPYGAFSIHRRDEVIGDFSDFAARLKQILMFALKAGRQRAGRLLQGIFGILKACRKIRSSLGSRRVRHARAGRSVAYRQPLPSEAPRTR